jgi:hypothetical protein
MTGLAAPWELTGEGKEKGEKEGSSGARLGGGTAGGLGLGLRATVRELLPVCYPSAVRAVAWCA